MNIIKITYPDGVEVKAGDKFDSSSGTGFVEFVVDTIDYANQIGTHELGIMVNIDRMGSVFFPTWSFADEGFILIKRADSDDAF